MGAFSFFHCRRTSPTPASAALGRPSPPQAGEGEPPALRRLLVRGAMRHYYAASLNRDRTKGDRRDWQAADAAAATAPALRSSVKDAAPRLGHEAQTAYPPNRKFAFQTALIDAPSRSRGAERPRGAVNVPPSPLRGRAERRTPDASAASCAQGKHTSLSPRPHRKSSGVPHAVSFRLASRSPRRTVETCHRRLRRNPESPRLKAPGAVRISQDHTIWAGAGGVVVIRRSKGPSRASEVTHAASSEASMPVSGLRPETLRFRPDAAASTATPPRRP